MPTLKVSFKTPASIEALQTKGPQIIQVLRTKLTALLFQLQSYVVSQKLSGQILNRRTGILSGSIRANPATLEGTIISGNVQGAGGPAFYGAVHELGGSKEYSIVPVKARALSFIRDGQRVFAKRVMHPPLRQRAFMGPSLDENAAKIKSELNAALNKVIAE